MLTKQSESFCDWKLINLHRLFNFRFTWVLFSAWERVPAEFLFCRVFKEFIYSQGGITSPPWPAAPMLVSLTGSRWPVCYMWRNTFYLVALDLVCKMTLYFWSSCLCVLCALCLLVSRQADFKLRNPPALASKVLGFKVWATRSGSLEVLLNVYI